MAEPNPFEAIFGRPTALIEREIAERGARERAGIAAGTAARALAEQQRQFDAQQAQMRAVAERWAQTQRDFGVGAAIPNPELPAGAGQAGKLGASSPGSMAQAVRAFVQTPEFISLGQTQNGAQMAKLIQDLMATGTSPAIEAFTLAPQARRYVPGPDGQLQVIENPNRPPATFERQGPLHAQRAATIGEWNTQGQAAGELEAQLPDLERALSTPGGSDLSVLGAAHNMWRAQLGLPASGTTAQIVDAITTRFIGPLHKEQGGGPMTNQDRQALARALPNIGNSVEANRTVLEILRRSVTNAATRGELAQWALAQNTPEALTMALEAVSDPAKMRQFLAAQIARDYNIPIERLSPRTEAEVVALTRQIAETNGGLVPPRAARFLRQLMGRIRATNR